MRVVAVAAACAVAVSACSSDSDDDAAAPSSTMSPSSTAMASTASVKSASDLRVRLNYLLGDHVILAGKATGAALGGRTDEFNAYGTQLNQNGTDVGSLIGAAFGADAQTQFNGIWSAHNGFFVDYTNGVAKQDKPKQDKAVSDLTNTYVPQFSSFLAGATGLDQKMVAGHVTEHVLSTKAIVDAQYAKDNTKVASSTRTAYTHMKMLGDPVAEAIAARFPTKFPSAGTKSAADPRNTLDLALQEHLYLATHATGAAIGGRTGEFTAWGDALNKNGTELGAAIGSIYGPEAQTQFNGIWSAHNGFFVDYTNGVATQDKAKQDKAVADLTTTYVPQFTDFLVGATGLQRDTVTQLVTEHVTSTKMVVDGQHAKNWTKTASDDRHAAMHMQMLGDPLADAIVKKFPEKFSA